MKAGVSMTTFTAQHSMFEGLYDRVLKPDGEFRDAIKAAGYDSANPKNEYPIAVWQGCLEATARYKHPGLDRDAALRAIGRSFLNGYFETIVGRLIAAAFPYFSPRSFVTRVPRLLRAGIKELETDLEWQSKTKARLVLHGPHEGACFMSAGIAEECFARLKVPVRIEAKALEGIESEIVFDWSTPSS